MSGLSSIDSSLAAVNTMVAALWKQRFAEAQNNLPWAAVTSDMGKSSASIRGFDWFGEVPEMVETSRAHQMFGGLRRYSYSLTHLEYSMGLAFRLADLNTDQLGQIPGRIQGAARKAASHPGRLALDQLESNPTGYDGAAFFANTHAFGAAANADNLAGGNGVTATDIEADIATVRATMKRFQDDTGQAMEIAPDTFVIPPELSLVFRKVLGPVREAGGVDSQLAVVDPGDGNIWQAGGYTVLELGRLSDTNNWYALHTRGEVKPLIYSWVQQPAPLNTPSLNDDSAKHRHALEHVFYGQYAVGVSLPQYAIAVVN